VKESSFESKERKLEKLQERFFTKENSEQEKKSKEKIGNNFQKKKWERKKN